MIARAKLEEIKLENRSTKFCKTLKARLVQHRILALILEMLVKSIAHFVVLRVITYDDCRKKQNEKESDTKQVRNINETKTCNYRKKSGRFLKEFRKLEFKLDRENEDLCDYFSRFRQKTRISWKNVSRNLARES